MLLEGRVGVLDNGIVGLDGLPEERIGGGVLITEPVNLNNKICSEILIQHLLGISHARSPLSLA